MARKHTIIQPSFEKLLDQFDTTIVISCKRFLDEVAARMYPNSRSRESLLFEGINSEKFLRGLEDKHHYFHTSVTATCFECAHKNDDPFDAASQAIKSAAFFRDREQGKRIYYPVVIFDGIDGIHPITEVADKNLDSAMPTQRLLSAVNYSYRSVNDGSLKRQDFLVDFVHEDALPAFLNKIEDEIGGVRDYLEGLARSQINDATSIKPLRSYGSRFR